MRFESELDATGEQSTVFVIETEQVVRSALHYILRDHYRTLAFATLRDALAATGIPDMVLLGSTALQNEGDAILAELRKLFSGARILIVADRNSDPFVQAALERGAHGVISKPISFDSVSDAVDRALARPSPTGEPSHIIRATFG